MSGALEIRPTSIREHAATPEAITGAILDHFAHHDADVIVRSVGQHLVLTHAAHLRHFWSPWLHVEVEAHDRASRVIAKFTPHPNLWTSFAFGYFTLGALAFFAGFCALAQAMLRQSAWAWWVAAGAAVGMLAMFVFAKLGQRLAAQQMGDLSTRLDAVLAGVGLGAGSSDGVGPVDRV